MNSDDSNEAFGVERELLERIPGSLEVDLGLKSNGEWQPGAFEILGNYASK